jgi:hypothetical protein
MPRASSTFTDVEYEGVVRGGIHACAATPRMLYKMKKDTIRPLDRADAADLKVKFCIEDK